MSIEFFGRWRYLSSPPEQVSQSEYKHAPSIVPAVWECWEKWRQNTETITKSIPSRLHHGSSISSLSFVDISKVDWLMASAKWLASLCPTKHVLGLTAPKGPEPGDLSSSNPFGWMAEIRPLGVLRGYRDHKRCRHQEWIPPTLIRCGKAHEDESSTI